MCLFYDIQRSKYYSFSLLFTLYKVHELHKQGGVISCHVNKHVSLISASTHTFEPYPNQELIAIQTATQFIARIKTPLHAFDCNPKTESKFFFFFHGLAQWCHPSYHYYSGWVQTPKHDYIPQIKWRKLWRFERQMNLMMLLLPNLKIGTTFMLLKSTISYRGSSGLPCHVALGFHIKIDQNLLDIEPRRIKSIHFRFLCLQLYFAGTIGRCRSIIERCWWHCSLCLIPWSS